MTTEEYITKAKAVHGDFYDYSKTEYVNSDTKITVICPVHGEFLVNPGEHSKGKCCIKCSKGEKFLETVKERFGVEYGTERYLYVNSSTPVELVCPKHGAFARTPAQILGSACGCPGCGNDKSQAQRDAAHAEALARQEEEKRQRETEERQFNLDRCAERNVEILRWEKKLDERNASHTQLPESKWIDNCEIYKRLVDEYIDVIRYNAKWIEPLREQHRLPEEEAKELPFYQDGDIVYKYDGRAPKQFVIDSYNKHFSRLNLSFEEYLAKRECVLHFDCEDLYITETTYRQDLATDLFELFEASSGVAEPCKRHSTRGNVADLQDLPTSFIGIDFETLYPQRVSACSVGMVKYKDGQIVDRYYTLIRPPFDYPGKKGMALTWIHGFTEDMFQGERTMEDIFPEMEAFAEGLPLVAHNCCVERACIEETARYYGITTSLDTNNIIDTLPLSRNTEKALGIFQDGPGLHSLNVVCNRFGVEELHHHNALDDAEMCGNLLIALKQASSISNYAIPETSTTSRKYSKYNEEDKQQRTDLENVPDNPFKDCCVVLTGFANSLSKEYGHKLKEAGAKICAGVSFKTKWLICGPNAGPAKMEKAKQVGAQIINEERFLELIN